MSLRLKVIIRGSIWHARGCASVRAIDSSLDLVLYRWVGCLCEVLGAYVDVDIPTPAFKSFALHSRPR